MMIQVGNAFSDGLCQKSRSVYMLYCCRYQRVRQLLAAMGLDLPTTPKPQPTLSSFGPDAAAAAGSGSAAELDPEKLRAVFEALLSNPASRTLMRKLLAGAGMPFDEAAFEEQIKDATYFNLAIAPILRKMPPQKLAVLADLQVGVEDFAFKAAHGSNKVDNFCCITCLALEDRGSFAHAWSSGCRHALRRVALLGCPTWHQRAVFVT